MNYTQNFHLPQWQATDRIHHDDFNDAFAKIDAAVKTNSTAIASKASAADLTAETQARTQAVSAEATARQSADTALQNALSAEAAARAAALAAVSANLGTHGHNARIATGSYTGSGTCESANPNTLTFDFHPLLVMVYSTAGDKVPYPAPMTLLRPHTRARSDSMGTNIGDSNIVTVAWSNKSVSWWATLASYQNNVNGATYHYAAIGYDKDAENA